MQASSSSDHVLDSINMNQLTLAALLSAAQMVVMFRLIMQHDLLSYMKIMLMTRRV